MLRLETLLTHDVEWVHTASLTLLAEVGVHVGLPEAADRLAGAGACAEVEGGGARAHSARSR